MHRKQYKTPKSSKIRGTPLTAKETTTTESGDSSTESCASSTNGDLSIVAEYDALIRMLKQDGELLHFTEEFASFVEQMRQINEHCLKAQTEVKRLRIDNAKISEDYEAKLQVARKMLDQEKRRARRLEEECHELDRKMDAAAQILFNKQNRLPDHLVRELDFLRRGRSSMVDVGVPQLSAIQEVNTTGSLISDFSYSRSEDDLDTSVAFCHKFNSTMKTPRRSGEMLTMEPPTKKRRSTNRAVEINAADTVRATTTLTVTKDGPITATSVIESVPPEAIKNVNDFRPSAPPAHLVSNNNNNNFASGSNTNVRQHQFQSKIVMIPETCALCDKRIKFGRNVYKCVQCRSHCHPECKDLLPLPCVPNVNTPQKGALGTISDYTPTSSPMVPALIIHCMKEVESRGYNELGIYRIPGSEREVKSLKEKFLSGKGLPCLSQVDVHVICGTIKDFLRTLQEPLVSNARRSDFIKAVEMANRNEAIPILNQIVSELPQPNRDTLAYVLLHLQRVSNMPECKMTADNLAKVFGPTIVGYSSSDCNSEQLLTDTRQQFMLMNELIGLSSDFWESFLENSCDFKTPTGKLQQTPSTDSLLYPRNKGGIFSPYAMKSFGKRKQKFFPSPDKYL